MSVSGYIFWIFGFFAIFFSVLVSIYYALKVDNIYKQEQGQDNRLSNDEILKQRLLSGELSPEEYETLKHMHSG